MTRAAQQHREHAFSVDEASALYASAFHDAPVGMGVIGLDGRFRQVNPALCTLLGRTEDELVGASTGPLTHPDDVEVTADAYRHLSASDAPLAVLKRYLRPDGEVVWAATQGISIRDDDGNARYIVAHFRDVTAEKLAEHERAAAEAQFELAFGHAPIGMALVSLDGRWLKVNQRLCDLTGYSEEHLLRTSFQVMTHPDDLAADLELLDRLVAGEIDHYVLEKRYLAAGGREIWVRLAVSLAVVDGAPAHLVAHIEDISERRSMQTALQRLADRDPLTDVWNRRCFADELERRVAHHRRSADTSALFVLDLDGFKAVNDRHGHPIGDALLQAIAGALSTRTRSGDVVARMGGDEFAVLMADVTPGAVAGLADALRATVIAATVRVGGGSAGAGASVGGVLIDRTTAGAEQAMASADAAMYAAKAANRAAARA